MADRARSHSPTELTKSSRFGAFLSFLVFDLDFVLPPPAAAEAVRASLTLPNAPHSMVTGASSTPEYFRTMLVVVSV